MLFWGLVTYFSGPGGPVPDRRSLSTPVLRGPRSSLSATAPRARRGQIISLFTYFTLLSLNLLKPPLGGVPPPKFLE